MCNRYRTAQDIEKLRTIFSNAPEEWLIEQKHDSVYPQSQVPVYLRPQGEEMFANFQWGILPVWARAKSAAVTNTRKESIFEKRIWTESFRRRRCLMPATSFFEPATINGKKYQMEFRLKDAEVFAFPGLWSKTELFGEPRNCCSLITCEPNELVGEVHGRMPVILRPEHFDTYLNTPPEQAEQLLDLLVPYPAEQMEGEFEAKEPKGDLPGLFHV